MKRCSEEKDDVYVDETTKRDVFTQSALGREMGTAMLSEMVIPNSTRNTSIYETANGKKTGNCGIPSFKDQMKSLPLNDQVRKLSSTQLSDVDLRVRWQFAVDLFYLLREEFPSCQVYPFGSLITGLADKSSDIDIYVDWKGDSGLSLGSVTWSEGQRRISGVQSRVANLLFNAKCPHTGVRFAAKVKCIGHRVPIVRFRHNPSRVKCDLSFGSKLAVNNSKLIKFFLDYDPRVKPLIVFLRAWAGYWKLSGSTKIKKYALSLLAIVFFANKKIIPTIEQLQICASAERLDKKIKTVDHLTEGWDSSFCTHLERIHGLFKPDPATKLPLDYRENPGTTLIQNLTDFFELITKTDFKEYIVCPLLGQMISKDNFISERLAKGLPSERLREWRNSYTTDTSFRKETKMQRPFVIQDPFGLDQNVARLVNRNILEKFLQLCEEAHEASLTYPVTSVLDVFY